MIFKFFAVGLALVIALFIIVHKYRLNRVGRINQAAGEQFLAENRMQPGVRALESGLQIATSVEGAGVVHPTMASTVKVHYHGTLLDGTVFDSSVDRGDPIEFALGQVIKGWTEGVQLMVEGETARLFIPSYLAYGNSAVGVIEPGSTLIFDVELISIFNQ